MMSTFYSKSSLAAAKKWCLSTIYTLWCKFLTSLTQYVYVAVLKNGNALAECPSLCDTTPGLVFTWLLPGTQPRECSTSQVNPVGDLVIPLPTVIFSVTTNVISEVFKKFVRFIYDEHITWLTYFRTVRFVKF